MKKITFNEERDLVKLLSKANVNHLEVFSKIDFGAKKSKMTRLFEFMRDQEFESADEIKSALYGKDSKADGNFMRMFHKFQEKLVNTLFFVDTSSSMFSERSKAYYNCAKRSHIIRILSERGLRNLAIDMAENTLPICIKYEFTELNIAFLKFLIRQFSSNIINKSKLNRYSKLFSKWVIEYEKEIFLEPIFNKLNFIENSNLLHKLQTNMSELKTAVDDSIKILESNPSIEVLISITRILLFYFHQIKDFENYKKYSQLILDRILSKPFLSIVMLENVVNAQLSAAPLTKDIKFAQELYDKYFDKYNYGNFNWYVGNYYYILSMIHSGEYETGKNVLTISVANKTFEKQPDIIRENFYVLQAYMSYLDKIGKTSPLLHIVSSFRINKFLNQVPTFSKDKQGVNIPIILVQIFFYLADKKYSKIIDRMESLNLYSYRHLKMDKNLRSQCFIKMISEMVRADFKRRGTIFRTEKLLIKLKSVPLSSFPNSLDIEIIPYEDLWAMILEILD